MFKSFLLAAAALLFCGCAVLQKEESVMRVGIISDIQGNALRQDWGMYNLARAFDMLAPMNIDVLLVPGDIADRGDLEVYRIYNELLKEKFGKNIPLQVICDGNHDFWLPKKQASAKTFSDFCKAMGQSGANPYHVNIQGYDFVALSTFDGNRYMVKALKETDKLLKKLTAANPGKPIFVLTHFGPKNTVTGSFVHGRTELMNIFRKYPEVVSLSGHTHIPLEDERSIWQGEFTAIQTSTVNYGCIEDKVVNTVNGIVPFAREVNQLLCMDIYPERLEIRRYNITDNREIAPEKRWNIALPYKPENAVYTAKRKETAETPEFADGAQMLVRYDYGFIYLIIDSASKGGFPHFYDVEIAEKDSAGNWKVRGSHRYVSNFYRLTGNKESREFFKLPPNALGKATEYRFRVYPVETFGNRGRAMEEIIYAPAEWSRTKSQDNPYPQE